MIRGFKLTRQPSAAYAAIVNSWPMIALAISSIALTHLFLRLWYKPPGQIVHLTIISALANAVLWLTAVIAFCAWDNKSPVLALLGLGYGISLVFSTLTCLLYQARPNWICNGTFGISLSVLASLGMAVQIVMTISHVREWHQQPDLLHRPGSESLMLHTDLTLCTMFALAAVIGIGCNIARSTSLQNKTRVA